MDASKMQIGILTDSNWITWKYKIMIALKGLRVLDIVEGRILQPDQSPPNAKPEQLLQYETALQKYLTGDSTALLVITTNLSEANLEKVMRFSSSREVWLELHRLFDGVSEDKAYDLCMKFFGYSIQPDDNIATHLSKLKNIWTELTRELQKEHSQEVLPELFLICKILETLPEEYFSFKHKNYKK